MRLAVLALLLPALVAPAAAPAAAQGPEWRIDRVVDDRLVLRATMTAAACPDWAQALTGFGAARIVADRMVGGERLIRVAYDETGVTAECLGGLALLGGPAARLRDRVSP